MPAPLGNFERIFVDDALFTLLFTTIGYAAEQRNIMRRDMGEKPLTEKNGRILSR